jgi:hypothetical protein
MSGSAATDTAIYRVSMETQPNTISGITTAQNNANVEMGRSLVAKKK